MLAAILFAAGGVGAASAQEILWRDGDVPIVIQLGNLPGFPAGTSPDQLALEALEEWNPLMARVRLLGTIAPPAPPVAEDGINSIGFSATIYGWAFPDRVLAVAPVWFEGDRRRESDVVVNTAYTWTRRSGEPIDHGTGAVDLRRVLVHEVGHVLGLEHPDEVRRPGIWSVMNSIIGGAEVPTLDDRQMIAALYGNSAANPLVPVWVRPISSTSQQRREGEGLGLSVAVGGSPYLSAVWRRNGVPVQTLARLPVDSHSLTFSLPAVTLADAGTYDAVVTNRAGSVVSAPMVLEVLPASAPVVIGQTPRMVHLAGGEVSLSVEVAGNRPLRYQWFRNGELIPDARNSTFVAHSLGAFAETTYTVRIENSLGVVVSPPFRVEEEEFVLAIRRELSFMHNNLGFIGQAQPVIYRWTRNGQVLPGADSNVYTVPPGEAGDGVFGLRVEQPTGTFQVSAVTVARPTPETMGPPPLPAMALVGGILHVPVPGPDGRVERLDVARRVWLAPWRPAGGVQAMTGNTQAVYIASGPAILRWRAGEADPAVFITLSGPASAIGLAEPFLVVAYRDGGTVETRQLADGSVAGRLAVSCTGNCNFGVEEVRGPPRRFQLRSTPLDRPQTEIYSVRDTGQIARERTADSPGSRTVAVSSDGLLSLFEDGRMQRHFSIGMSGQLPLGLTDALEIGPREFIAAGRSQLVRIDDAGVAARFSLPEPAWRIFRMGEDFVVVHPPAAAGALPSVTRVRPEQFTPEPPAVIAPNEPWTAEATAMDGRGIVYAITADRLRIARWQVHEERWLEPFASPVRLGSQLRVLPGDSALQFRDWDGRVWSYDLTAARPRARPNRGTFWEIHADDLALTLGEHYGGTTIRARSGTGTLLGELPAPAAFDQPRSWLWEPIRRRVYAESGAGRQIASVSVSREGRLSVGATRSVPFPASPMTGLLLAATPDGRRLVTSDGEMLDADTLQVVGYLESTLRRAVVSGGRLIGVRNTRGGARFMMLDPESGRVGRSALHRGIVLGLHALPDGTLAAVMSREGQTFVMRLDADLRATGRTPLPPRRLANISARAFVGGEGGAHTLVPGFVIQGSAAKRVLLRAVGPGLRRFGVTEAVPDPILTVFDARAQPFARNGNWGEAINFRDAAVLGDTVGAFSLSEGSMDAAMVVTLQPGLYTLEATGRTGHEGIALVEVYDLEAAGDGSRLINISARAVVGIGGSAVVPGIVIDGSEPKEVLIRGIGPALAPFGVTNALADPAIRLFRGQQVLETNGNWSSAANAAAVETTAARVGAFPLPAGSRDAALLVTLAPGIYTVEVTGRTPEWGVTLVEVYQVR